MNLGTQLANNKFMKKFKILLWIEYPIPSNDIRGYYENVLFFGAEIIRFALFTIRPLVHNLKLQSGPNALKMSQLEPSFAVAGRIRYYVVSFQ